MSNPSLTPPPPLPHPSPTPRYDHTVRNAIDGSVLQFVSGEDGLDPTKVHYFFDIWEEWGRHIWGKWLSGCFFIVFSKASFVDIWEEWGRHIWGKRVVGMFLLFFFIIC